MATPNKNNNKLVVNKQQPPASTNRPKKGAAAAKNDYGLIGKDKVQTKMDDFAPPGIEVEEQKVHGTSQETPPIMAS